MDIDKRIAFLQKQLGELREAWKLASSISAKNNIQEAGMNTKREIEMLKSVLEHRERTKKYSNSSLNF